MKTLDKFKKGDTFAFIATLTDQTGALITGVAAKLKAEIRTGTGLLVASCVISETVTAGSYLFVVTDTSLWEVSTLYLDVQYTDSGIVTSSETVTIPVVKGITA